MAVSTYLADIWSATDFRTPELAGYAEERMRTGTRHGDQLVALMLLVIQLGALLTIPYHGESKSHL